MTPLKSSNIKSVGYDPASQRLTVAFHSGTTHSYDDVPEHHYSGLLKAESAGKYFHEHIRSGYETRKRS